MTKTYKEMIVEASKLLEQSNPRPNFAGRVEEICISEDIARQCALQLTPKLLEMGEAYRKEDEEYLEQVKRQLDEDLQSINEDGLARSKQRAQIIKKSLESNETLHVLHRVGQVIDQRWDKLVSGETGR